VVETQRGVDGGYRLARPADQVTIADIMRPLDGPLAEVRGEKPEEAVYSGPATHLRDVWVAVRGAVRGVLENVTLADIVAGQLPSAVEELLERPGAWERRTTAAAQPVSSPRSLAGTVLDVMRPRLSFIYIASVCEVLRCCSGCGACRRRRRCSWCGTRSR
jgi:hypothetical protein